MTSIQAVHIRSYEERSEPKAHTVYRIEVQANVRAWQIWRRYSEFAELHADLARDTGAPPPAELPPKHALSLFRSRTNNNILEERKAGLEQYLRAIISSREDRWRESLPFKKFLGVPTGRAGNNAPAAFSTSSWMDEHTELENILRDVRADVNKRDALTDRGDVPAAHKANVGAKAKLAKLIPRIGALARGLQELGMGGMSEGELQRRTDMVGRLQDDCEKLGKMLTVARWSSTAPQGRGAYAAQPAPDSDRDALLGTSSGGAKPFARVFGQKAKPQETEETRPLDDVGVFNLQQVQMHRQDDQLSQLTTILARQRQMGEAIGSEISYQNTLLDDLTNDVDKVGDKLTKAGRQMARLG
ncbi:syntaxin [Schizophyllum amplum]|uniref:Syntaxin n=1 Tax=Schizophyllum amplum TaxID=97359 RepID=A0A550CMZ4_9AGAR|nr:syntaxin [Auriculariopsis ampla]